LENPEDESGIYGTRYRKVKVLQMYNQKMSDSKKTRYVNTGYANEKIFLVPP